jgi:hypothetical protein
MSHFEPFNEDALWNFSVWQGRTSSQRRDPIMVSIEQKFYAIRETEFAIDGSEVVGNRGIANVKLARNLFVAQAFAYAADDLVLAFGKR